LDGVRCLTAPGTGQRQTGLSLSLFCAGPVADVGNLLLPVGAGVELWFLLLLSAGFRRLVARR